MSQLISGVSQHGTHISLSLVIKETMRRRIHISQIRGTEGFYHVTGFIVQLAEIIGMGLDLHTDPLPFNDGKQFLHRFKPHPVADFLLVGITGKLCIDDFNPHICRNFYHPFPICHRELALLLCGTRPAVHYDKRRNLHAGLL